MKSGGVTARPPAQRLSLPIALMFSVGLVLASLAPTSAPATGTPGQLTASPAPQQPSPSPSDTVPTATPTPSFVPRTVTTVMTGDLLWHNSTYTGVRTGQPAGSPDEFDFSRMFAALQPIISGADLAICHEEVPFSAPGGPYLNYPIFAAPPQIGRLIADTGWDACTVDSNHTLDQGIDGLIRTNTVLREAGVTPVGTFRTAQEREQPVIMTTASGVRIGLVGGTYGLNGFALPADQQWAVSMWDVDNLLAQARAARVAGADIVMVQIHGGNEYQTAPSDEQVALATALTDDPAVDVVFGQHVHVVQPITTINGKPVVYGMGNLVAQQPISQPRTWEGIVVRLTFTEQAPGQFSVTGFEYIPTLITPSGAGPVTVLPVKSTLTAGTGPTARLQEAEAATVAAVTSLNPPPGLIES